MRVLEIPAIDFNMGFLMRQVEYVDRNDFLQIINIVFRMGVFDKLTNYFRLSKYFLSSLLSSSLDNMSGLRSKVRFKDCSLRHRAILA